MRYIDRIYRMNKIVFVERRKFCVFTLITANGFITYREVLAIPNEAKGSPGDRQDLLLGLT